MSPSSPAAISHARFSDYKLLRSVELELGCLNVVVGRNGAGKSSLLEGMLNLLQLATPKPGEDHRPDSRPGIVFSGPRSVGNLVSRPDGTAFELEVTLADGRRFGLKAESAEDEERFETWFGLPETEARTEHPTMRSFVEPFKAGLGKVVHLHLDADNLARPHYSDVESPRVEHDGSGLPSVLQYLHGLRDGTFEAIEADVAAVVPGVKRIRVLPARIARREKVRILVNDQETWTEQLRELTGARFEVEWADVGWIPAEHVSEGTLLTLGLVTVLRFHPPRLLLLDDLDRALHPVAQRDVIALLRRVQALDPGLQIVATSHSPFVLDALAPEEVFVAGLATPGSARVRRLDSHPAWASKGRYLGPGGFWSAIGEGWVAVGEP